MKSNALKYAFLFFSSATLLVLSEVVLFQYKLIPLIIIPLSFLAVHLLIFTKDFKKEILFIVSSFALGFSLEITMSFLDVYHFGLVDLRGFNWPAPWVASLWLILPVFLVQSVKILKTHPVPGAYAGALIVYGLYSILGEEADLIFFHHPKIQTALFFILAWHLLIRSLFKVHKKIFLETT